MEQKKALGYLLSRCARTYKKIVNREMEKYELTAVQCGVIRMLHHCGKLTQVQIAERYASDKATMGKVILSLSKKGFLIKEASSEDKRAYAISLSPRAYEIAHEIEERSNSMEKIAFKGFHEEEIEKFRDFLDRIIQNLDQESERE